MLPASLAKQIPSDDDPTLGRRLCQLEPSVGMKDDVPVRTQRIQDDNPGVPSREQRDAGEMMAEPIAASVIRRPQTVSGDIPSAVSPVISSRASPSLDLGMRSLLSTGGISARPMKE
jgi:hypothetical protein